MTTTTETVERPLTQTGGGSADGEHYAHIVKRPDDFPGGASAYVTDAMVFGREVEALCGYRWVPCRDPERLPVCAACKSILEATP